MNIQLLKHALVFAAVLSVGGCATTAGKAAALNTAGSDALNGIGGASIGELVSVSPNDEFDESSVIVATEYTAASGRVCRRLQTTDGMSLPRVVCKGDKGKWSWARDLVPASNQPKNKQTSFRDLSKQNKTALVTKAPATAVVDTADSGVADAKQQMGTNEEDELNLSALEAEDVVEVEVVNELLETSALENAALEPGEIAILPNETLWAFAKRTTGNPLNWQRIAELNDIEDTRTIVNGEILQVPVELLRDGD